MVNRTRVLVVDDSPAVLSRVREALLRAGYEVVTALDGEAGLAMAVATQPAVVLLDVILTKKSGYQVCRELKGDPRTQAAVVILMCATGRESDRLWGLRQGADAAVAEPWHDEELLALVARLSARGTSTAGSAA